MTHHPHNYHHVCLPETCELAHPIRSRLTQPLMALVYLLAAPVGRAIDAATTDEEDTA